jgi:hypothetical protein
VVAHVASLDALGLHRERSRVLIYCSRLRSLCVARCRHVSTPTTLTLTLTIIGRKRRLVSAAPERSRWNQASSSGGVGVQVCRCAGVRVCVLACAGAGARALALWVGIAHPIPVQSEKSPSTTCSEPVHLTPTKASQRSGSPCKDESSRGALGSLYRTCTSTLLVQYEAYTSTIPVNTLYRVFGASITQSPPWTSSSHPTPSTASTPALPRPFALKLIRALSSPRFHRMIRIQLMAYYILYCTVRGAHKNPELGNRNSYKGTRAIVILTPHPAPRDSSQ